MITQEELDRWERLSASVNAHLIKARSAFDEGHAATAAYHIGIAQVIHTEAHAIMLAAGATDSKQG